MVNSIKYEASSIQVLKGLDAIRKRPGMYIGSTGLNGLHQLLYEVVDNSVDEHVAGFATNITVEICKNNTIIVTDNGRGIPVDMHPTENKSALELVLTTIHAGGKFDNNSYNTSSGLHGIGLSAVNALSEYLQAEVYRDDNCYTQEYSRGVPVTPVKKEALKNIRGTRIVFKPDPDIFKKLTFDVDIIKTRLIELAYLNPKLEIVFVNDTERQILSYANGLKEYVQYLNQGLSVIHKPIRITKKTKNYSFELVFQYNTAFSDDKIKSFANNISTSEGGTHLNAVKAGLLKYIREVIKDEKLLKKTNLEIMTKNILEGIALVVSVKLSNPEFESQTKIKLNNPDIRQPIENDVYEALKAKRFPFEVIEKIVESVKVRDITKKARKLVSRKGIIDNTLPGKLADCTDTDPSKCELFIVEGQSAAGSAKQGRNRKTQAVLALKGKILNIEKTTTNKMLENDEIKSIVKALGVTIDSDDLSKLRYNKIIILTDADIDGGHICCLLLTFFYRYFKPLIDNGYLYVAQPPLYRVKKGNYEQYCVNDQQLNQVLKQYKNAVVQRFKGLGEMLPEQLHETILNPSNRQLLRVTVSDGQVANDMFEMFMGDKVEDRRNYIMNKADGIYDNN